MKKRTLKLILLLAVTFTPTVFADCFLGTNTTKDVYGALKIFKIVAPLLMLGYTIFDLVKMLATGAAPGGKEAPPPKQVASRFVKRLVAVLILFIVPVLVNQVFVWAGIWNDEGMCDLSEGDIDDDGELWANDCSQIALDSCTKYTNCKVYKQGLETGRCVSNGKTKVAGGVTWGTTSGSGGEGTTTTSKSGGGYTGEVYQNPDTGTHALNYVNIAIQMANDNTIGYSNKVNYNLKNPDVDCGSFITYALKAAGYTFPKGIFEPGSKYKLEAAGFKCYTFDKSKLKDGDVIITEKNHHTELYIGNNKLVAAHQNYNHPEPGDQNGKEVSITNFWDDGWEYYCRLA